MPSMRCTFVGHWMTSDVNKWRDVMQSLRQSYDLLTFLYVKHVKTVNGNKWYTDYLTGYW